MTDRSTRTTADEPAEGTDPGGTRPAPAVKTAVEQKVTSGDRNTGTPGSTTHGAQPQDKTPS